MEQLISKWYFWVCVVLIILVLILVFHGRRESKFIGIGFSDDVMVRHGVEEFSDEPPCPRAEGVYAPRRAYGSKRERQCRSILESIFGKEFPTKRPSFLRNPETGRNLELDCYNEELKLALEYNGKQHYVWPNTFHRTKDEFIQQIRRDRYKHEVCNNMGIFLIIVPYNVKDLERYIMERIPPSLTHKMALRLVELSRR